MNVAECAPIPLYAVYEENKKGIHFLKWSKFNERPLCSGTYYLVQRGTTEEIKSCTATPNIVAKTVDGAVIWYLYPRLAGFGFSAQYIEDFLESFADCVTTKSLEHKGCLVLVRKE